MLIRKSDLKRVISETVGRLNEMHHDGGAPCPIATANQLHASGASDLEVQDFIQQLLGQFAQAAAEPVQVQSYQEFPQRGGVIGGVGF